MPAAELAGLSPPQIRSSLQRVRSQALGQNFLQNRRTARRVAHLAGADHDLLCVDLGAGNGAITDASLLLRSGPIRAIEVDARLVERLGKRFADEPRVTVVEADLKRATPPTEPFVIAANPPFNLSTFLVRRWLAAASFQSGAMIVEKPFAERVSGGYGSTKLSLSLAAFVDLDVPFDVRPAEFNPRPRVDAAILTSARRAEPAVPWRERWAYWTFANYLFERGQHTVSAAIEPLKLTGVPRDVQRRPVREVTLDDVVELNRLVGDGPTPPRRVIDAFEATLPANRQTALGDVEPTSGRRGRPRR